MIVKGLSPQRKRESLVLGGMQAQPGSGIRLRGKNDLGYPRTATNAGKTMLCVRLGSENVTYRGRATSPAGVGTVSDSASLQGDQLVSPDESCYILNEK